MPKEKTIKCWIVLDKSWDIATRKNEWFNAYIYTGKKPVENGKEKILQILPCTIILNPRTKNGKTKRA